MYTHKKAFPGGGEFAKVMLRFEPLPVGEGLKVVNGMKEDWIPAGLVEAIDEGVREAAKTGVLAGKPVTDLRVTIMDAAFHEIDSTRETFRLAAQRAFWKGMRKAGVDIRAR